MNTKYVLDTSALIKNPSILSKAGAVDMYIPAAVVNEWVSRARHDDSPEISALVNRAVHAGAVIYDYPLEIPLGSEFAEEIRSRLSAADSVVARLASSLANKHGVENVKVVTQDKGISRYLHGSKIGSVSAEEFLSETKSSAVDEGISEDARKYSKSQWIRFIAGIVSGIIGSALFDLAYKNADAILSSAPTAGVIVGILSAGTILFWIRENFRLHYGVTEFLVGYLMTYYTFSPLLAGSGVSVGVLLQALAGLYVMVRGLDNVGKGVEGTKFEHVWRRIFQRARA